jgi:RNA polymerase-binding protein DksA
MPDEFDFRNALLTKRQELLERVSAISRDRHRPGNADSTEQAVELENQEVLSALDDEARHTLQLIEQALTRLEEGRYGDCLRCGEAIAPARLRAIPYAAFCIRCAEQRDQGGPG